MLEVKGSQFQLQKLINNNPNFVTESLLCSNHSLLLYSQDVEWVSPLKEQQYKEYKDNLLELLFEGESLEKVNQKLRQFWPARGPVWDGVGIVHGVDGRKGLILIEAKSYPAESKSALKAKSLDSREKIISRIVEVKAKVNSTSAIEVWTNQYYQMANRLCFTCFLNEQLGIPTWLVLCNFVNDSSFKRTSRIEWLQHQKNIWKALGVNSESKLMGRVITIYPECTSD